MRTRIGLVTALTVVACVLVVGRAGAAGIDEGLCSFEGDRLTVPTGFPVDVCFDGRELHVANRSQFILRLNLGGDVSTPVRTKLAAPSAASMVMAGFLSDASVLPPDYRVAIPIGGGAADATVEADHSNDVQFAIAKIIAEAGPVGWAVTSYDIVAELIRTGSSIYTEARQCLAANNVVGDASCLLAASQAWIEAVQKFKLSLAIETLAALPKAFLNLLLLAVDEVSLLDDAERFAGAARTVDIRAVDAGSTEDPPPITNSPPTDVPPSETVETPGPPANADRRGVTSYNEMRGGAPYWGYFDYAYQDFVAQSDVITYLGVTVGSQGYPSGERTSTRIRIRLCGDASCSHPLAVVEPTILNYGNTDVDIGDVRVTAGNTYFVRWDQPARANGKGWDTFWWRSTSGPSGRSPIENGDRLQMVVRGYNTD